jgi:hypothetical protein
MGLLSSPLWGQDIKTPPECTYKGLYVQVGNTVVQRQVHLSDPTYVRTQGQQYQVLLSVQDITSDVVGVMVRIARLKQSEGEHPADQGDDHGNPRSDEDHVEYRWSLLPGLDPTEVFQGFCTSNGSYDSIGCITLGTDIPIVFDQLITEKEYRINLFVWSTHAPEPGQAFSRMPLEETRNTMYKFKGSDDATALALHRGRRWSEESQGNLPVVRATWQGLPEGQVAGFRLLSRDSEGNTVVVTPEPVREAAFEADVDTMIIQGAADGAPLGVQAVTGGETIGLIGGGGILIDACLIPQCPRIGTPVLSAVTQKTGTIDVLQFSWTAASNATSYQVWRATPSCSGEFSLIATLASDTLRYECPLPRNSDHVNSEIL